MMISITPIPAFNDNYFWLIAYQGNAIVVDPGDAAPVDQYLELNNLTLKAILITHHHHDHTGGIAKLKAKYHCQVYGPNYQYDHTNPAIPEVEKHLAEGDSFEIAEFPLQFEVLEIPGHTLDHIAYVMRAESLQNLQLFCGDTIFSGGCGRLFEGDPATMWRSLQKLLNLPNTTQIYPAHEYTLANLEFAKTVEPNNSALLKYYEKVKQLRQQNLPSLPTQLSLEKNINPFLRVDNSDFKQALNIESNHLLNDPVQLFGKIRRQKDTF
ncbi:hydroxyacylglutathione hydrolase [Aliikangiella sp. IMCC44653]